MLGGVADGIAAVCTGSASDDVLRQVQKILRQVVLQEVQGGARAHSVRCNHSCRLIHACCLPVWFAPSCDCNDVLNCSCRRHAQLAFGMRGITVLPGTATSATPSKLTHPTRETLRPCDPPSGLVLQGYQGVWEHNGTTLKCYPAGHQAPTAIIVGVVAAAAVLIIGLLALWQYLTTRPRWLRQRILQVRMCPACLGMF